MTMEFNVELFQYQGTLFPQVRRLPFVSPLQRRAHLVLLAGQHPL